MEAQELLGHKDVDKMDVMFQENFFPKDLNLMALLPNREYAIELCAGKGRMTRELLSFLFRRVHCHDQCPKLRDYWNEINAELK